MQIYNHEPDATQLFWLAKLLSSVFTHKREIDYFSCQKSSAVREMHLSI